LHTEHGLSTTHEMYLKVLYRLERENDVGRVRDMAKGLGVTPSTVSAVLKKLEHGGLVDHDRYGIVKLTPSGTRVAECVVRRFEILKALLVNVLGLDAEAAEIDACMMEHAVSPATVNRMQLLVHRVRRGDVVLEAMPSGGSSVSACADCEASGMCQAVATSDVASPVDEADGVENK
jgi:DtxR family transcriptional regulator, Mn-dependent transcriptional regulator